MVESIQASTRILWLGSLGGKNIYTPPNLNYLIACETPCTKNRNLATTNRPATRRTPVSGSVLTAGDAYRGGHTLPPLALTCLGFIGERRGNIVIDYSLSAAAS